MNGRERALAFLAGRAVDRLPCMPLTMMFASDRIGAKYLAYATDFRVHVEGQIRVAEDFDFDYVSFGTDPACEAADCGASVMYFPDQPPAIDESQALLADKRKLATSRVPDPYAPGRMNNGLQAVALFKARVGKEKLIEAWVEGPMAESADLRGINAIMLDVYDDPSFVRDLFAFVVEMELRWAMAEIEAGADLIAIGDAAASLVNPRTYAEMVWPFEKQMVDVIHSTGARVRLHICGNTRLILENMGRLGCDIVDLDYLAPVSLAREKMGPQQVLMGNIDPVRSLRDGTPETIGRDLAECHRQAGNRFVIGAGCEIPRDTPPENVRALSQYAKAHPINAWQRYGGSFNLNHELISEMSEIFSTECMEQKALLDEVFSAYSVDPEIRAELERAKKGIRAGLPLVWLGMGASYCSSISGATRYSLAGRPSFPVEASEWLHYAFATWDAVGGPILITTSGESAELVELCGRREEFPRLLICNQPASPCWKAAAIHLPILAGEEKGNATKSYINCTAVCMILASELLGHSWQTEAARVQNAFAQALGQAFTLRQEIESFCRGIASLEIVGRGAGLGGALMGALTVREMTEWRAYGYSGGAFRHGPLMDVDAAHVAIILALGATRDLGRRLADDCIARGGKAVLVVDRDPVQHTKGLLTVKIEPVPEGWEGLTSVLVPQALTQALIERLGSRYVRRATTVQ